MAFFDFDDFMDLAEADHGEQVSSESGVDKIGGEHVDVQPALLGPLPKSSTLWDGVEQLVIVCGVARSGTTLLVDMLGLHSRLSPLYETYFVTHLAHLVFHSGLEVGRLRSAVLEFMEKWTEPLPLRDIPGFKGEYERFHHGPNYLLFSRELAMQRTRHFLVELCAGRPRMPAFARLVSSLFTEHARQDGKRIIVNKTPSYTDILPLLARMYPQLKVVHCVRDGRDVACSVLARPWGPSTAHEASRWWAQKAGLATKWGQNNPDRYLDIRYEDVLDRPHRELERLWTFVGVENETDRVLGFYGGSVPLDKGRAGAWRSRGGMSCFLEGQSGDLLRHFGYVTRKEVQAKKHSPNEHLQADPEWFFHQLAQSHADEMEDDESWEWCTEVHKYQR